MLETNLNRFYQFSRCIWIIQVVCHRSSHECHHEEFSQGEVEGWKTHTTYVMGEEHKVHVGSLSYNTDDDSLKYFFEDKVQVDVVEG